MRRIKNHDVTAQIPPVFRNALIIVTIIGIVQETLTFTLPLLALDMQGTGTSLALIKGAGVIPIILFAIFISALNDRLRKGRAFRGYSVAIVLVLTLLMIGTLTDQISIAGMVLFAIVFNGLVYGIDNAQFTVVRLSVHQEHLSDATAMSSTVFATLSTAGPAVAGFALLQLGHTGVIIASTGLVAIAAMLSLTIAPKEEPPAPTPLLQSIKQGSAVLWENRELFHMTVSIIFTNAAVGAFVTALILKLKTVAFYSEFQIGIVLAVSGVGAIVTSRFTAPLRRKWGYRGAFFWPILALAATYGVFVLDMQFWWIITLMFIEGGLTMFYNIGIWSYRQETTQAQFMGRVAGITGSVFKLAIPPVMIFAGYLSDQGNLNTAYAMAAGLNIAAAAYLAIVGRWGLPRVR